MKLRDYQQRAVDGTFAAWEKAQSALIVLPTGCGKTVVFSEIVRRVLAERRGRGMVLAHREELVTQAQAKLAEMTGEEVAIEMAEQRALPFLGVEPPIVVSTVQTQNSNGRMKRFDPKDFAVLVVDEAHHATSASYRRVIDWFLKGNPSCKLLGVTATPDRKDKTALGNVFSEVACEYGVMDAINDGWLVPVRQQLVSVESLDFSGISTSAGDLNQTELAELMEQEENLQRIAAPTLEIAANRRAIVFAASVKQAERLAEILNRGANDCADWLCGETPKEERREKLARFKRGELKFMVNVGVLTEGFDDAGVDVVVMARPTKSRALYAQMAGRATRPAAEIAAKLGEVGIETQAASPHADFEKSDVPTPASLREPPARSAFLEVSSEGAAESAQTLAKTDRVVRGIPRVVDTSVFAKSACAKGTCVQMSPAAARRALIAQSSKPSCLILDFVGNAGRHKLITSADILGGKYDDEVVARAKRNMAANNPADDPDGADVSSELEKAKAELEEEKKKVELARKSVLARAKYATRTIDPFDRFDLVEASVADPTMVISPTEETRLRKFLGKEYDRTTLTRRQALVGEMRRRKCAKVATLGQTRYLARYGFVSPLRQDEASRIIDRLSKKQGWGWRK